MQRTSLLCSSVFVALVVSTTGISAEPAAASPSAARVSHHPRPPRPKPRPTTTTTAAAPTTTTAAPIPTSPTSVATTVALPTTLAPASSTTPLAPATTAPTTTQLTAPTTTPTTTQPPKSAPGSKPLLIEHGWDASTAASAKTNAARIDTLPFDGISIAPAFNPCGVTPVTLAQAQADLNAMPKLTKVTHNFVLCRLIDSAAPGSTVGPFDMANDATWATITANLSVYAQAARATGMFDGFMIDTEYYGTGPNPWDHDTIPIPWTYGASRPWTLPAAAKAQAQRRGKQTMDALRAAWPDVVAFHLRGAELSDPANTKPENMMGNEVSWANEMAGPFFVGAVESTLGSAATIVDGGESYRQRTLADFQKAYSWLKTRFADSGGPIVPSAGVSAADYRATVQVASQVFDRDMNNGYAPMGAAEVQTLLSYARQATDRYLWLYTEQFDWKGTGWPQTPAPAQFIAAVSQS
jgi:hypothetical protein